MLKVKRKPFIITIDTESDNQWDLSKAQTTENARFIPRFQELCEQFSFFPVYLIDYSMANDDFLTEYLKEKAKSNLCEIGMHLHAWDTPPVIEHNTERRPYLVEYPMDVMKRKVETLLECLTTRFDQNIVSHRAGRWIINENYLLLLEDVGIKFDCSVTPGMTWSGDVGKYAGAVEYNERVQIAPYIIPGTSICEVPVSIHKIRGTKVSTNGNTISTVKDMVRHFTGKKIWMRPSLCQYDDMLLLLEYVKENDAYLEFMMHSSEFMPGGSPYYVSEDDIDDMYDSLQKLFVRISDQFIGKMIKEMAITDN